MTDGFKQACLVKPMHPIESLPLQRLDGLPGAFLANQLRFVKSVDRLGQCIVVAVSGAAHRGLNSRLQEPDAEQVLSDLITRYVESLVYQAVSENMACEQSARMVAMKAASDNAKQLIDELQLSYNKARQAAITKELSEIVGGAAAV